MVIFYIILFPILAIIFLIGVIFYVQGPPFVPSDDETTEEMVKMVKKYKGKKVIDLGSGDGKLVIALAKAGCEAHGVELNPLLVLQSRRRIREEKLKNAYIHWGNFWTIDLSSYDTVVIYGIKHIMKQLGKKMKQEMTPKSHIITNFFIFPQWKPVESRKRLLAYTV